MDSRDTLLAANAAFYAAFATCDLAAMAGLWAEDDTISCIHPGWPAIVGHTAVVASWREILANSSGTDIVCHDPHAIVAGSDGRVLCIESINGHLLAATNSFRLIAGAWRLVHHQASAISTAPPQQPAAPPSGKLH